MPLAKFLGADRHKWAFPSVEVDDVRLKSQNGGPDRAVSLIIVDLGDLQAYVTLRTRKRGRLRAKVDHRFMRS